MQPERHAVCIVGDDLVGCAVACALAVEAGFDGSILVLDPEPRSRATAAPPRWAALRQQWPTALNVAIARFGARFIRRLDRHLAINGTATEVAFDERGALVLADETERAHRRAEYAAGVCSGAEVHWLSPGELADRFPWLTTIDLEGAALGLSGEGLVDAAALRSAFRAKARALGVTFRSDHLAAIEASGGGPVRLITGREPAVDCEFVVNAAGTRARSVAALAGFDLPVHARPRWSFRFETAESAPDLPLTVLPEGVRVHREGNALRADWAHGDPVSTPDQAADADAVFDRVVLPALARRIPACNRIRVQESGVHYEDVLALDGNPILGPHPANDRLLLAAGCSGHDALQAPAIGRGLAEWIVHGRPRTLDLTPLDFRRVAAGEPFAGASVTG